MRRTGFLDLLAPVLVFGLLVYLVLGRIYDDLPPMQYLTGVPILALAVAEMVAARRVRAAVRHDPRAKPMAAIVIARCVALGKASSLGGAGVVGGAVALLVYVLPDVGMVRAAAADARVAVAVGVAAVVLTVAGLLLERAGIDPNRDEGEP
jgi:hypothetical protein